MKITKKKIKEIINKYLERVKEHSNDEEIYIKSERIKNRIAVKYCRNFGLDIKYMNNDRIHKQGCRYNGKYLITDSNYHEDYWSILHELGHWVCCTEKRRSCREYGLGSFQYDDDRNEYLISDKKEEMLEEYATCLISGLFEMDLKLGIATLQETNFIEIHVDTAEWQYWSETYSKFEDPFIFLIENNLITENLEITGNIRK